MVTNINLVHSFRTMFERQILKLPPALLQHGDDDVIRLARKRMRTVFKVPEHL